METPQQSYSSSTEPNNCREKHYKTSQKTSTTIAKAAGRESVHVKFAGIGAGKFSNYVMVELDEQENLAGTTFDAEVFVSLPASSLEAV